MWHGVHQRMILGDAKSNQLHRRFMQEETVFVTYLPKLPHSPLSCQSLLSLFLFHSLSPRLPSPLFLLLTPGPLTRAEAAAGRERVPAWRLRPGHRLEASSLDCWTVSSPQLYWHWQAGDRSEVCNLDVVSMVFTACLEEEGASWLGQAITI